MVETTTVKLNEHGLPEGISLGTAEERLREYVGDKLGVNLRVVRFQRMAGGASNATYAFDVVEADSTKSWNLIVRWDPEFGLVEPYDMARQYRVMHALQGSEVPIPRTYWLEEDLEVLGRAFFIVGQLDATIGNRVIVGSNRTSEQRRRRAHVQTLAAIHRTDWMRRGMGEFMELPSDGTAYALREITRWEAVINRKLHGRDSLLESVATWMRKNAVQTDEICLLHGDCSGTNYMYKGDDVAGVIDWEMSTLGDPMVEIGWYCGCIETLGVSINGLPPGEIVRARREFLANYVELTGRTLDHDKIKFGEVFYNYQLCSVSVSGEWMRRQRGEQPAAEPSGQNFRAELERLTRQ